MLDENGDQSGGGSRRVRSRCSVSPRCRARATRSSSSTRTAPPGRSPSAQARVRAQRACQQAGLPRGPGQAAQGGREAAAQPDHQGRRVRFGRGPRGRAAQDRRRRRGRAARHRPRCRCDHRDDVNLAIASDAIIIGFNVRPRARPPSWPTARAWTSATTRSSTRRSRRSRRPSRACSSRSTRRSSSGTAEIREVFRSSKVGNIAGCMVRSARSAQRQGPPAPRRRRSSSVAENLTISSLRGSRTTPPRSARASSAV
jgi:hypothetical protein